MRARDSGYVPSFSVERKGSFLFLLHASAAEFHRYSVELTYRSASLSPSGMKERPFLGKVIYSPLGDKSPSCLKVKSAWHISPSFLLLELRHLKSLSPKLACLLLLSSPRQAHRDGRRDRYFSLLHKPARALLSRRQAAPSPFLTFVSALGSTS